MSMCLFVLFTLSCVCLHCLTRTRRNAWVCVHVCGACMSFHHNLDRYAVFRVFKHQKRAVWLFCTFFHLAHFGPLCVAARRRPTAVVHVHSLTRDAQIRGYVCVAARCPERLPAAKSCTLFTRRQTQAHTHLHMCKMLKSMQHSLPRKI